MAYTSQALYIAQVIQLARSVVIKLDSAAEVMNKYLVSIGKSVDKNKPETWIYYKHLAGQYHPTDSKMTITSLDTREEIDFTYDNLKYHRATANAYNEKGDYYKDLVNRFPEQLDLIDGILNPVPIQTAINAANFSILTYDTNLVNPNETNLITKLQEYIIGFADTWYNHNYCYLFDEYPAMFLNDILTFMPGAIINIRKFNVRTEYVHDYHLWAYLGSHQRIDKYRDYLTREQSMWLYRNIAYLESHPGWTSTFEELVKWLLTKRTIPLTSFELVHNLESLPDSITPGTEIAKIPLNDYAFSSAGVKKVSIETTLRNEVPLANANQDYLDQQITNVPKDFGLNKHSTLQTKVLESDMVDRSDAQPIHYMQTLFNEWFYLTATNKFVATFNITNPFTTEVMSMTEKEAVITWLYCLHRSLGIDVEVVPSFLAMNVMRPISPTFNELRSMSPRAYISEQMLLAVLDEYVPQKTIISIDQFTETVTNIHNAITSMRYLYTNQENFHIRGHLENATRRMYMDHRCTFVEGIVNYKDWFAAKGWKIMTMTDAQCKEFGNTLLVKATGLNLKNVNSMRSIQHAMIQLLQQLSSYSIQFLSHITDASTNVIDWPMIRPGDVDSDSSIEARLKLRTAVLRVYGSDTSSYDWEVGNTVKIDENSLHIGNNIYGFYPMNAGFTANTKVVTTRRIKIPLAKLALSRNKDIVEPIDITALNGVWIYDVQPDGTPEVKDGLESSELDFVYPDPVGPTEDEFDEASGMSTNFIANATSLEETFFSAKLINFSVLTPYLSLEETFDKEVLSGLTLQLPLDELFINDNLSGF